MKALLLAPLILSLAIATSGCMGSDCETSNEPSGQRVVCTTPKTFSYTRNGSMVSEKKDYQWENSGTTATVSAAFNSSSGTATVVVKDADGKTVYNKSHSWNGQTAEDQPTMSGKAGTWTISINLGGLTGQVALNVRAT